VTAESLSPYWNALLTVLHLGGLVAVALIVAALVIHGIRFGLRVLRSSFQ
jgi:hypothetical protein